MDYVNSEILFLNPTSHISSIWQPYVANSYHNQTGLMGLLSKTLHIESFLFLVIRGNKGCSQGKSMRDLSLLWIFEKFFDSRSVYACNGLS